MEVAPLDNVVCPSENQQAHAQLPMSPDLQYYLFVTGPPSLTSDHKVGRMAALIQLLYLPAERKAHQYRHGLEKLR